MSEPSASGPFAVRVERMEDGWWVACVDGLGIATQATRADQIEAMARDLIATWLGVDVAEVGPVELVGVEVPAAKPCDGSGPRAAGTPGS